MSEPLAILLRLVVSFLIGSIPFAVLSMTGSGIDIRTVGSGNPGFNNVLRVSKGRAVVVLLGDMGKGYFAVWLALRTWHLGGNTALGWIFGFAAVLGHCYSPFLKFHGGKGVATSGGVMLVLYPMWAVIALTYFSVARVGASKLRWPESGTIASLSTWVLFVLLMLLFVGGLDAAFALVMTFFLAWRHRKNFQNLMNSRQISTGPARG